MIELNFTLIIQLVIVLSLMAILTQILFKPFLSVLQERRNRIEGAEKRAKDLQQQAEELIERYREAIASGQAQGAGIRDEIRKTSLAEETEILQKAMDEANRLIQEVKTRISEEARAARIDLRLQAHNLSREITEKILGRSV
ncbi:MAG: F0F1-type synthase, beta subunit [Deltaproteobacteria bacterium]|jgi:F-type H+-transporting ATPase subunit b|nr:F0F1-type synthase, beta subunit [Deltaproteobacteria bacterium]MBP1718809.1 F0F1-type synthase, beta subunit [Deltaproteobacteria bacterium]